jgi:lysophospholipase L1-like esterase
LPSFLIHNRTDPVDRVDADPSPIGANRMRVRTAAAWSAVLALTAAAIAPALAAPPTSAPTTAPGRRPTIHPDEPAAKLDKTGNIEPRFKKMHESFLARGKAGPIGVLFLGDSITEGWGKAPDVWKQHYGADQPANFGIGGDRTEHVLWRIANGELDGIHPKVVVLMIGTNNVAPNATAGIIAGDEKIVAQIHQKLPDTKLLLLAIFPRGADPADPKVAATRAKIKTINAALAKLDDGDKTRYLDIGDKFLSKDGSLSKDIMPDALHPNAKGYQIWADAMQPLLDEMLKSSK